MLMPSPIHQGGHAPLSPKPALADLQQHDGAWEGEVVWCPIITAQVAIVRTILGKSDDENWKKGIRRYFQVTQNQDGGWGLHPLSPSYLFVTTLVYVAARLVGEVPNGLLASRARTWIHGHPEGLVALPSWGKLWMAFIGLYPYVGINPVMPEFFLLPKWFPVSADRTLCHTRYIYVGLAYLYGRRFVAHLGEMGQMLKQELYAQPLNNATAIRNRHRIASTDLYTAPGTTLRLIYDVLRYTGIAVRKWRIGQHLHQRALVRCLEMIRNEIASTHGRCLSPVNGVLHLLDLYAADPSDPTIDLALESLETWRWEDTHTGIRYAGARSQSWDTAFALRALLARPDNTSSNVTPVRDVIRRGYAYLASQQCGPGPMPRNQDRYETLGGWCFCDKEHGWPVSDCTAEAVSALLSCHEVPGLIAETECIHPERLMEAMQFILARQNADGGFGSYEPNRAPKFLENINVSEMFARSTTERSYIECTASCIEAIAMLRRYLSLHVDMESQVKSSLSRGIAFLRKAQEQDGSYPGFWGINFVYATSFVLRALSCVGLDQSDTTVQRALAWLKTRQRADGGWGEHYSGCLGHQYVEHNESQISSTSWALLGLMAFLKTDEATIRRGIAWLHERRNSHHLWEREPVNGVFYDTAMLEYTLYNPIFGTWAFAKGNAPEQAHDHR